MWILIISLTYLLIRIWVWFKNLSREFIFCGWGSEFILRMFKLGFIVFIFSEIMFFIRFFWTYFHLLLLMSRELGTFPGIYLEIPDYQLLACLNTLLLLRRGVSLTNAHLSLLSLNYKNYAVNISITFFLGLIFISCQLLEYKQLRFMVSDRSYARIFYLTTRFHGSHVLIGLIILIVVYIKSFPSNRILFEIASWYWHFVDVVWLFLFSFYYWIIR